ncbi:MAG: AMP-binding protein, partial [Burkholderiales bacterium]
VVFTSGSTGRPAPHVKTWGSLVRGALALGRHLGLAPSTAPQIIGTVPPQHMFGLEATVMLPLQWRGALDAGRPLLPSDIKAALEAAPEPRWLMTTPLQLRACVDDALELGCELRGVISSTMPLEAPLAHAAEALWHCPVEEIYGSSETGMMALRRTARGSTWTLCEDLSLRVADAAMRVQGGHLDTPFTLTDRIELEGARGFRLLGRIGDMIKVAGKRTSLDDLNARLRAVPGVVDGTFYMPDRAGRPVAFAVAPAATRESILEALRRDLDPVFLPRPLYLVDALPRAANGKIARDGLEALLHRMSAR